MMKDLLSLLADGKEKTRDKLTALLGCSTDELTQQLMQLQQGGISLELTATQVRLIPQLALLDHQQLRTGLSPYQLHIQPVISSTNQYILEHIQQFRKGDLCLAEYQCAGRGRRGRQWLSPFAGQIIMSFYWTLPSPAHLNGISLAIGLAIAECLRKLGVPAYVKWPNDILLLERKLGGILVEMSNLNNGLINLVVGIGLNLSLPREADDFITQPWIALCELLPDLDRNQLIIQLTQAIYAELQQFEQQGISDQFRLRWTALDYLFGEQVNVLQDTQRISGIAQGITSQGYLQIIQQNGDVQHFHAGDVSLRKKTD